MSKWIVKGDTTSHCGTVLEGDPIFTSDGIPVARVGDMVACPKCKGVFPIVTGAPNLIGSNGQRAARGGDRTACGAELVAGGQEHGDWVGSGNGQAAAVAGEIGMLQSVFGSTLDYSKVKIHNETYLPN